MTGDGRLSLPFRTRLDKTAWGQMGPAGCLQGGQTLNTLWRGVGSMIPPESKYRICLFLYCHPITLLICFSYVSRQSSHLCTCFIIEMYPF